MGPGLPPGRQKQFAPAATSTSILSQTLRSAEGRRVCAIDRRELPPQTPSNPIARVCL